MSLFDQLNRHLDKLAHPVITSPHRTLEMQLRTYLRNVRRWRQPVKSMIMIAKIISMMTGATLLTPVAWLLKQKGVRFVCIDMTQIGSVLYLDLLVRENRVRYQTPPNKLFVARSAYMDVNPFCYDFYKPHVRFVTSPGLKLLLSPFFMHPLLRETAFRFDCGATFFADKGERLTVAHEIWQAHDDQFGEPVVSMTDSDKERGQEIMSALLPPEKKFVALHVRDNGYYGSSHRTTRNADIHTYEEAIRYLIGQGFAVVRVGDANMVPIDDMVERCGPDLVDYARSSIKSDFMDCYLCSQCEFLIGLTSGLWSVPIVFGRPACNVNCYNTTLAPGFGSRDLSTVKKIRRTDDGSLLPFEAFLRKPLLATPQHDALKAQGLYLENNSAEEIRDTLKEFLERKDDRATDLQQAVKEKFQPLHYCWRARGNYSMVTLRTYFPNGIDDSRSDPSLNGSDVRHVGAADQPQRNAASHLRSASSEQLA